MADNVSAVPGPSQAISFTACRASTRSVRGVTPSLLDDVGPVSARPLS